MGEVPAAFPVVILAWTNGAHVNIWGWTDGEVSLMMSGCFTSTHQSDEKELGHSTGAYNTHLYIKRIH